ncbi:polysaccharide biosynthesis C-terminal domain-containing protein, partial [Patescibacteria group bacterium]|nr:polysaccharide biosynthesis C-terminal domain-containing protein [Patescibacteria group bacterium]
IIQIGFNVLLIGGFLVFVLGNLSARWLVNLLGGSDFGPSVGYLRGLLVLLWIGYLNHCTGYSLIALKKQGRHLVHGIFGILVSLLSHFLFTNLFGPIGVVVALAAGELTIFLLSYTYLRHKMQIKISFQPVEAINYFIMIVRKNG